MSHKLAKKLSAKITTDQQSRPQAIAHKKPTVNLGIAVPEKKQKVELKEDLRSNIAGKNKNM